MCASASHPAARGPETARCRCRCCPSRLLLPRLLLHRPCTAVPSAARSHECDAVHHLLPGRPDRLQTPAFVGDHTLPAVSENATAPPQWIADLNLDPLSRFDRYIRAKVRQLYISLFHAYARKNNMWILDHGEARIKSDPTPKRFYSSITSSITPNLIILILVIFTVIKGNLFSSVQFPVRI